METFVRRCEDDKKHVTDLFAGDGLQIVGVFEKQIVVYHVKVFVVLLKVSQDAKEQWQFNDVNFILIKERLPGFLGYCFASWAIPS